MLVILETSQSPITPFLFLLAKTGHDPSTVSPKQPPLQTSLLFSHTHLPTAACKAALSAGVKTPSTTSTKVNSISNRNGYKHRRSAPQPNLCTLCTTPLHFDAGTPPARARRQNAPTTRNLLATEGIPKLSFDGFMLGKFWAVVGVADHVNDSAAICERLVRVGAVSNIGKPVAIGRLQVVCSCFAGFCCEK